MTRSVLHGRDALQRHGHPTLARQPGSCGHRVLDACRCGNHLSSGSCIGWIFLSPLYCCSASSGQSRRIRRNTSDKNGDRDQHTPDQPSSQARLSDLHTFWNSKWRLVRYNESVKACMYLRLHPQRRKRHPRSSHWHRTQHVRQRSSWIPSPHCRSLSSARKARDALDQVRIAQAVNDITVSWAGVQREHRQEPLLSASLTRHDRTRL